MSDHHRNKLAPVRPQVPPARRDASALETRFAARGALPWTTGTTTPPLDEIDQD
jgi:hypothetical protein